MAVFRGLGRFILRVSGRSESEGRGGRLFLIEGERGLPYLEWMEVVIF